MALEMSKNRSAPFMVGMLVGSAIGTIAGILVAPVSGRQTRQLLKKSAEALPDLAEDLSSSVRLQASSLSESARDNWDRTLERLRVAIAAGVEASQQQGAILNQEENGFSPESTAQQSSSD